MTIPQMNIYPYCNCHATGKWNKGDGYAYDGPGNLWVHSRCRKPSKLAYERYVLGLEPIPQPKIVEVDIYKKELMYDARKIIATELTILGWDDDEEE